MARICAIDTETTSLRPDRRAWEIGIVVRDPGKPDTEHRWFVEHEDLDLGNADVMSLKVGRFYERHPAYANGDFSKWVGGSEIGPELWVLEQVEAITRGAHLVGAVVSFDAEVLGTRMRAHGICPSWHYHLIDCEALAVGFLAARADAIAEHDGAASAQPLREIIQPPYKSDDLSRALGVTVSDEDRHTALGDAKWAMRLYDEVLGGGS